MSDDSAYGRVTNPERYAVLHSAIDEIVDELTSQYDVSVEAVAPEWNHARHLGLTATRLTPSNGGAPVTITLTSFPGLSVRIGDRHVERFPECGCDGCDEQPEDVVEDLRRKLACVADGGFRDIRGGYEFVFGDGGRHSGTQATLRAEQARDYDAWPPR